MLKTQIVPAFLKQMIDRDEFQRRIEIQRLESAQKTDDHISALATAMTTMTERMTLMLSNQSNIMKRQDDILTSLKDGIAAMRERVSNREGYERGKKEHKKGDTGPLSDDAENS